MSIITNTKTKAELLADSRERTARRNEAVLNIAKKAVEGGINDAYYSNKWTPQEWFDAQGDKGVATVTGLMTAIGFIQTFEPDYAMPETGHEPATITEEDTVENIGGEDITVTVQKVVVGNKIEE